MITILNYCYHDKIESLISRNHFLKLEIHGKSAKSQVPPPQPAPTMVDLNYYTKENVAKSQDLSSLDQRLKVIYNTHIKKNPWKVNALDKKM